MRLHLVAGILWVSLCLTSAHATMAREFEQDDNELFNEYQIKALFLYNFANFVEWPDDAFASPSAPLRMCLFGNVPFGTLLDTVDGTAIGKRVLKVDHNKKAKEIATGCHILFVGNDRREDLPHLWRQIEYFYVLSVGEHEQFLNRGGIINIVRTQDQLSFDINLSNAMTAGVFVSSDLLHIAREIKRNTRITN